MVLEICIDEGVGLDAAIAGGADRVELCGALSLGGLTPAPSLIAAAAAAPIPSHMLIRPREGGFRYTAREAAMVAADIDAAAQAGLAGIVIGAARADHRLDTDMLAAWIAQARKAGNARGTVLSLTLHRAFDLCPDQMVALEEAIALGFDRILTSGGEPRAPEGVAGLAALHRRAAGRIIIMAGSGIDATTVAPILATGITEIHASCGAPVTFADTDTEAHETERRFGFVGPNRRVTDPGRIRALRAIMTKTLQTVS